MVAQAIIGQFLSEVKPMMRFERRRDAEQPGAQEKTSALAPIRHMLELECHQWPFRTSSS